MNRILFFALSLSCGCAHISAPADTDPLPVQRVVLYQNGVGYFERAGTVHGDTLRLSVRPEQINDLLTSLTIIDLAGGRSQSISLPIEKSAAQRLDELPEQVRREGGILSLLSAFRGARVAVETESGFASLSGRVVGVEDLDDAPHLTLATGTSLTNIPVGSIRTLRLLDRPLQVGLTKVLDHSLNQGKWKPVELTVRFDRDGKHDLLVSYIAAMPTWKPAYRLVMGKAGEGALLQGWAVVDNTSGEDWNQIQLSLSSGAPISFIYDLHKPHFITRPTVAVRRGGATAPVASAGVAAARMSSRRYREKKLKKTAKKGRRAGAPRPEMAMEDESSGVGALGSYFGSGGGGGGISRVGGMGSVSLEKLAGSQDLGAGGEAVGGLFRYDIAGPVTVPDRSSTLVSLVNRKIEGEDLMLYRPEAGGAAVKHPYRAVRFKNDTGYMLQGGPVTVFARGTFVGEGIFDRIEDGAETFLPFSLEQGISIRRSTKNAERPVRLIAISGGRIRCEVQSRRTQIFEVLRRAKDAPKQLVIRVAKRPGWKLAKPPEGTRELGGSWYVPAQVGEGKTAIEITDTLEHPRSVSWSTSLGRQTLALYLDNPDADPKVAAALKTINEAQKKSDELQTELRRAREGKRRMSREQDRLRRNIKTLGEAKVNRKLAQNMAKRLGANERSIAQFNARIVAAQEAIHSQQQRLKVLIDGISLGTK